MSAPLVVLVKFPATQTWSIVAGPVDVAGANAAVQAALASQGGAKAVVLALVASYSAQTTVTQDGSASMG